MTENANSIAATASRQGTLQGVDLALVAMEPLGKVPLPEPRHRVKVTFSLLEPPVRQAQESEVLVVGGRDGGDGRTDRVELRSNLNLGRVLHVRQSPDHQVGLDGVDLGPRRGVHRASWRPSVLPDVARHGRRKQREHPAGGPGRSRSRGAWDDLLPRGVPVPPVERRAGYGQLAEEVAAGEP